MKCTDKTATVIVFIAVFFLGIIAGYTVSDLKNSVYENNTSMSIPDKCPQNVTNTMELTDAQALKIAINDPKVMDLLGNYSIKSISFSKSNLSNYNCNEYSETCKMNYTMITFDPYDPDPKDCLLPTRIYAQINDSCEVSTAYHTYPVYIANCGD
ncbi:hypothetical protein J2128_001513 [Methanomicrobium sp. W14]|uniref:hypothetical protein n=1 Tax=Methanomicrobium sp. W14 TaxID=2817839 RepID=UPI001AE6321E|nr:hypothetical protein [Methanomicrobium sp. W14]MBP2133559.1 hypothetical protein [Methanomicrobium sp. W14]